MVKSKHRAFKTPRNEGVCTAAVGAERENIRQVGNLYHGFVSFHSDPEIEFGIARVQFSSINIRLVLLYHIY